MFYTFSTVSLCQPRGWKFWLQTVLLWKSVLKYRYRCQVADSVQSTGTQPSSGDFIKHNIEFSAGEVQLTLDGKKFKIGILSVFYIYPSIYLRRLYVFPTTWNLLFTTYYPELIWVHLQGTCLFLKLITFALWRNIWCWWSYITWMIYQLKPPIAITITTMPKEVNDRPISVTLVARGYYQTHLWSDRLVLAKPHHIDLFRHFAYFYYYHIPPVTFFFHFLNIGRLLQSETIGCDRCDPQ